MQTIEYFRNKKRIKKAERDTAALILDAATNVAKLYCKNKSYFDRLMV